MLKGGGFGAHDPKHGGRLPRQIALGPPGALRQVRDIEPSVEKAERLVEGVLAPQRLEPGQLRQAAEKVARAVRLKKKIGRPRFEGVRPWEAEGMSRATWFRRKKEVGGG